jgi:phosphoserine phosphatase
MSATTADSTITNNNIPSNTISTSNTTPPTTTHPPPSIPNDTTIQRNSVATDEIIKRFLSADCICFDVDSTISREEGIDELAAYHGVGKEVSSYTSNAMNGNITLQQALHDRLHLIQPTRHSFDTFIQTHSFQLTPHIDELITLLHRCHKDVYLVSGGFKEMIVPIAKHLNIDENHVIANILIFDDTTGEYIGFDETQPTSRSGGKALALQYIKQQTKINQYKGIDGVEKQTISSIKIHGSASINDLIQRIVMIGDGVTDMEAAVEAVLFIGYGGVVEREKVKKSANWYIKDWNVLIDVLKKYCIKQETSSG